MPLSLMTFNVENLFARYRFRDLEQQHLVSLFDAFDPDDRANLIRTHWNALHDEMRTFTALTVLHADPDVICLQEVENTQALRAFHDRYLMRLGGRGRAPWPYHALVEGNDRRGINVAVMSRYPIDAMMTHQHIETLIPTALGPRRERVFRRDCLEVQLDCGDARLAVFVCHFKSMEGGRAESRAWRRLEAQAVREIVVRRFAGRQAEADWIVCGDLNDYTHEAGLPDLDHGLGPLLDDGFAVDLLDRISDPFERWTHFWGEADRYSQIDHVLASPHLAAANAGVIPVILRQGQPFRATRYQGPRWPRVGWDRPKASDHCPVVVRLDSLGSGPPAPPLIGAV